jgi:hypothetical protein
VATPPEEELPTRTETPFNGSFFSLMTFPVIVAVGWANARMVQSSPVTSNNVDLTVADLRAKVSAGCYRHVTSMLRNH